MKEPEGRAAQIYKGMISGALRNLIIASVVIVILWSLATYFLPSGWWIVVINILCLLSTLVTGSTFFGTLKILMSSGLALLISVVLWFLIVMGGRTLMLGLLDALVEA